MSAVLAGLLQAARHGDVDGAVVAAQLLDVHGDQEFILEHQYSQAFEHAGQSADSPWRSFVKRQSWSQSGLMSLKKDRPAGRGARPVAVRPDGWTNDDLAIC
jgi:hypothetical protein